MNHRSGDNFFRQLCGVSLNVARQYNKPFHYFSFSSAEKCAKQLVKSEVGFDITAELVSKTVAIVDICNNERFVDFVIENGVERVAIEINIGAVENYKK